MFHILPLFYTQNYFIMRKTFLFLSLALVFSNSASAQNFPYSFEYSNEPYALLNNAIELTPTAVWETGADIPVGFPFKFADEWHSTFVLDGYSGALFTTESYEFGDSTDAILGYTTYPGLINKPNTIVQYITEGTAPNRILKVEMYRVGFDGENGEVSFQIWLYETSNTIQFRLGNQTVPDPINTFFNQKSPIIGFMENYHYISLDESIFPEAQFVAGTPSSPVDTVVVNGYLDELVEDGPQYGLTGIPLNNSVFTFTPGTVPTTQPAISRLQFSPNPVQEALRLEGLNVQEATHIQLLDVQGRIISSQTLLAGETVLRLPENMAPGQYVLRCITGDKIAVAKLLKV